MHTLLNPQILDIDVPASSRTAFAMSNPNGGGRFGANKALQVHPNLVIAYSSASLQQTATADCEGPTFREHAGTPAEVGVPV